MDEPFGRSASHLANVSRCVGVVVVEVDATDRALNHRMCPGSDPTTRIPRVNPNSIKMTVQVAVQ